MLPLFVVSALKVTELPGHIVVALAVMLTPGVTGEFTVMETLLDETEAGTAQPALLVKTQLMISPFNKTPGVNDGLFVPALTAFTCH